MASPGMNTGWAGYSSAQDLIGPGIKPRSLHWPADFTVRITQCVRCIILVLFFTLPQKGVGLPLHFPGKEMKEEAALTALYPPTHCWKEGP